MRFVLLLLTAALPLTAGCTQEAATTTTPPPKAKAETAAAATPAPERRARAGIELGETPKSPAPTDKKRVPAAEFIVTNPPAKVPPLNAGPRSAAVAGALQWLDTQWRPRANGSDQDAYTTLLHAEFKGLRAGKDGVVTRDTWLAEREPRLGTPVVWGLERVTANPNSTGRLTIEMEEATSAPDACEVAKRSLTLQPHTPDAAGPWLIVTEERSPAKPCTAATVRDVIGVHSALTTAWRSRDLIAVRQAIHGGLVLRDGGVESERYNISALTNGDARWVLDQLATLTATPANTRVVGPEAVVNAGNGTRFGYRLMGDQWRLMTLWRAPTQAP